MATTQILAMADLQQQLAARLQSHKDSLPPPTSSRVRVKKDGFYLPDGSQLDELEAVIVDMRFVNTFYAKRYVPGQIDPPDCWSVSSDANNMLPSEDASKKQNDICGIAGEAGCCPKNEWGSAPGGGAGKACGNRLRIAVVTPDATDKSPTYIIDLPPTSAGALIKLTRSMSVPYQVVTMKFTTDQKVDYPKVLIEVMGPAPDALAPYLMGLIDKSQDLLDRGFNFD